MVFSFAGLRLRSSLSHEHMSGFVKSIFVVHSRNMDCIMPKSAIGVSGGARMIVAHLLVARADSAPAARADSAPAAQRADEEVAGLLT